MINNALLSLLHGKKFFQTLEFLPVKDQGQTVDGYREAFKSFADGLPAEITENQKDSEQIEYTFSLKGEGGNYIALNFDKESGKCVSLRGRWRGQTGFSVLFGVNNKDAGHTFAMEFIGRLGKVYTAGDFSKAVYNATQEVPQRFNPTAHANLAPSP